MIVQLLNYLGGARVKKEDNMKRITENKEKNENKNVCNCDVVHDNIVDTVKSKMPDENMLSDLSDFLRS